jgi:heterodisulfide reductase subunit C
MAANLANEINRLTAQAPELCYHCHKCTAGCPSVQVMSYGPDRVLRMVVLDQVEDVLRSRDIWLCVGCFTCTTRCPNGIDIAAVMDGLRQLAIARGYPAGERDVVLFHRLFLGLVKRLGQSHEAALLGLFKILSHIPIYNDLRAGVGLLLRGKVAILPIKTSASQEVKEIFRLSE